MARFEHGGDTYGCPPDLLDCSINLNPMGAPGPVLEGACRAVLDCARYPDPACAGPSPAGTAWRRTRSCAATGPPI